MHAPAALGGEPLPWMFHLMAVHGAEAARDLVRDRPRALHRSRPHASPHPPGDDRATRSCRTARARCWIRSSPIRQRITPGRRTQSVTIDIVTGVAETRDGCLGLIDKYHDRRLADRVFDLAWTHSQVVLRQLNASEADAQLYGRLAGSIIYANPSLRADPSRASAKNRRGQSGLWGYAISGDLPIVLLRIGDPANIELVRQLVQAHAYWRMQGLGGGSGDLERRPLRLPAGACRTRSWA